MATNIPRQIRMHCSFILLGLILGLLIGSKWNDIGPTDQNKSPSVNVDLKPTSGSRRSSDHAPFRGSKSSRVTPPQSARKEWRLQEIERQIHSLRQHADLQINELVIRLGLSEDQHERFEQLAEEKLKQYRSELQSQDPISAIGWRLDMLRLVDVLSESVLNDSQRKEFRFQREREREARIEAAAFLELSKLSTLDLNEDQKQQAFETLLEKARNEFQDSPKIPWYRAITEDQIPQVRKTLEESLARMQGILTPDQLRIYRKRLELEFGMSNVIERE